MALLPTMKVQKGDGPVITINTSDFASFKGNGYAEYVPAPVQSKEPEAPKDEDAQPAKPTLKELRERAAKLGVMNAGKLKEDELVKAIAEVSGTNPEN